MSMVAFGAFRIERLEPLVRRGNFGDQIANELLVRQGLDDDFTRGKAFKARVYGLAIHAHHAFLACVRVDAGEADGESGIVVRAYPAQRIQDRLSGLEWKLKRFVPPWLARTAAPYAQACHHFCHAVSFSMVRRSPVIRIAW